MKLKPLQLCRIGAYFTHGRRWIVLAAALLVSLILPSWLRVLALSVSLWLGALTGLYWFYLRSRRPASFLRDPNPQDALCETVLIDATLIGRGTLLRAAAQPVDVADQLSLRMGSGALLLGSAMVLTADTLSAPDKAAIHKAAEKLNIVPQRLLRHNPILRTEALGSLRTVTVRDGQNERRYFMGSPQDVSSLSLRIWEGEIRAMTDHDRERILDTAGYIAQGQCRVTAYATALGNETPVFLGLCGVGEEVEMQAIADISTLRGMGLTVLLDFSDAPDTDPDALHALLDLPGHHARADIHLVRKAASQEGALGILRQRGDSLAEPILSLQETFSGTEDALRRFLLLLGTVLLCGLFAGQWWLAPLMTLLLTLAALSLGIAPDAIPPRRGVLAGCIAITAGAWAFLGTRDMAAFGCDFLTAVMALTAALRLTGLRTPRQMKSHLPQLLILAGIALIAIVIALLVSLPVIALLPVLFTLLLGALCGILILLG